MGSKRWIPVTALIIAVAAVLIFYIMAQREPAKLVPVPGPVTTVTAAPQPVPTPTVTATVTATPQPVPTPTVTVTATPESDLSQVTKTIIGFVRARSNYDFEAMRPYMTSKLASFWVEGDVRYYAHAYYYTLNDMSSRYANFTLEYDIYKVEWSSGEVKYDHFKLKNQLYMMKTAEGWKIAAPSRVDCYVFLR